MIVNPLNADHKVQITPRMFPTDGITLKIVNSFNDSNDTISVTYKTTDNDKLELSFTYDFTDESSYSICVNDSITDEVLFRGIILATTQVTQDYSLTSFRYNWK